MDIAQLVQCLHACMKPWAGSPANINLECWSILVVPALVNWEVEAGKSSFKNIASLRPVELPEDSSNKERKR